MADSFRRIVEIVPPRGYDCTAELQGAQKLAALGIDAINVPDSPRASARMSAQSLCIQIQQKTGIETILHYTCRDRNLLSIQSDLLGAYSLGLRNVLCITGDPPKANPSLNATAVYDVDSIGLVKTVYNLNHAIDITGYPLDAPTDFTIGVGVNPGIPDIDREIQRLEQKIEAGAHYAITQPVFDIRLLESFLARIQSLHIPIIAGIWPLTSSRNAHFMRDSLGVSIADDVFARMQNPPTPDHARAEGILIAQEMLAAIQPMVHGVQVSAPFGHYDSACEVLSRMQSL